MPAIMTQAFVDKAKTTDKRQLVADGGCKGLYLDVRQAGKSFRYRYTDHKGVYKAVTIGDATVLKLAEARDKALKFKRERALGVGIGAEPVEDVPKYEDFVRHCYMPHALTVRRAAHNDWTLFNNHLFPVFGHKRLNEITRSDIGAFMQAKRAQGYMETTCNRLLARLKATLSYASEIEVVGFDKNPARGYRQFKEPIRNDRFLSQDEAERLLEAVRDSESPYLQYIIPFLLLTGARKSEALQARWEFIDFEARRWMIPLTKNGKPRHVPLSNGAITVLLATRQLHERLGITSPWLFPSPATHKPYTSIYYPWHVARKKAGLTDVRIHDLRHSFASALVNRGMTLYDVKEVLGHSNIVTTQRYAHLSQQRLQEAVTQADEHYRPRSLVHGPLPIHAPAPVIVEHETQLCLP